MDDIDFVDPKARALGGRIRRRREDLGLSQYDLGKAVGVSQATISRAEKGKVWLPTTSFLRLRVALGLSEDEFHMWVEAAA